MSWTQWLFLYSKGCPAWLGIGRHCAVVAQSNGMMFYVNSGRTIEYSSVSPKSYIVNLLISQEVYFIQHNIFMKGVQFIYLFIYWKTSRAYMFRFQLLNRHQEQYLYGLITYTDALLLITLNFLLPVQVSLQVFPICTSLLINTLLTVLNYNALLF